jgi:uncharacterized protein (DUF2336 family)
VAVDVNSTTITYDDAKELAVHDDSSVRAALARRADVAPEVLYFLAEDADPEVRRAVAENASAPGLSNILLARDDDTGVRTELATKIAASAPGLDAEEADKANRATYEALEMLARDQLKLVRGVLSEALKDVPGAPVDIIKTLANDLEIDVAGPVLQHSPVLQDDDLLEIISTTQVEGALNAVARRENLRENVSDAIVASDNDGAIADLLGNNSAQIREETLDQLIDKAEGVTLWHKPLVARRQLPEGAAQRMAHYLADNLLAELGQRTDLDEETLTEVRAAVSQRIDGGGAPAPEPTSGQDFLHGELPMDMVMRLYNARKLDARVVEKALMASDYNFVFASILVRAGVGPEVGRRIFLEKHPKAIMGLCWKAGLSAEMGVQVQKRMGRMAPSEILEAGKGGEYPLSDHDLAWQVEFFADMASMGRRN